MLDASWDDLQKLARKHNIDPDRLEYLQNCRCEFCCEELQRCGIALIPIKAFRQVPVEEDEAPAPVPEAAFKKPKAPKTASANKRRDEQIRARFKMGDTPKNIAKDHNLSEERVRQLTRGIVQEVEETEDIV